MFEIIPGILEKEWSEIERKIEVVKTFAKTASNAAPAIHIDIIDGKFAPNTTFLDPEPFQEYTNELFFELHMMVINPLKYLKPFADAGFKRFLGHVEKMPDQEAFVAQAQLFGEVGLAIDGPTDVSEIKVPYSDLDCVLIMTINAGQSGQEFSPEYLKKLEILSAKNDPSTLRQLADRSGLVIEVDGGINDKTILLAKEIGATRFVANSFILSGNDPQKQYEMLKQVQHDI